MTIEELKSEKTCAECLKTKPIFDFDYQSFNIDGHSCYCGKCEQKMIKELKFIGK